MITRWYKRDRQLTHWWSRVMVSRWYKTDRQLNSLVELGDDQSVVQERQTAQLTGGAE